MSESTFQIVGSGVMFVIAAALAFVAKRQTAREPLTRFAIVRAGVIGMAAVYACFIASRIAQQIVIALLVPVLFGGVLFVCARLFARIGARVLARTCAALGVLTLAVTAFLMWGWALSERAPDPPPEKSATEAARELRPHAE